MKNRTKIIIAVVGIFLLIQLPFFQPALNQGDIKETHNFEFWLDSLNIYPMDVAMNLQYACYDCHSNNTSYQRLDEKAEEKVDLWYMNIQPVSWWMNLHIKKGKEALNFSEFTALSTEEQAEAFLKIQESMEEKTMPLKSYNLTHPEGKLTDTEYKSIVEWAKKARDRVLHPEKYENEEIDTNDDFMVGGDDDFDEDAYIRALEKAAEEGTEIDWDF